MTAPAISRRIGVARSACVAVSLLALGLYALGLPIYHRQLQVVCAALPCHNSPTPEAARLLEAAGVSLAAFARLEVAANLFGVLVSALVALIIFSLRPADGIGWYTAAMLVTFSTFGVQGGEVLTGVLQAAGPLWRALAYTVAITGRTTISWFFLIFPDGRVVPRWAGWPVAALIVWQTTVAFFPAAWFDPITWPPVLNVAYWGLQFGMFMYAQAYRYRHVSTPPQRQQTKWVVFGFGLTTIASLAGYVLLGLASLLGPRWAPLALARDLSYLLVLPLLPVSIGVSILRYRLWDIDVIIRRTLIYSALTAVLALGYLGSVLALQGLFSTLTGESRNALATVLSTLAIAALFGPVRNRVQAAIDRRFYRRKYDAARTLAGFAASARDETDLARLSEQLLGVVEETMQPTSVGLWLKR